MKLLPIEMEDVKKEQREEKLVLINKYQDKLNFSTISLLFFALATAYTIIIPTLGIAAPIVSGALSLLFIQQTIRSYNYREFHKNSYKFMEGIYKAVGNNLKEKD